VLMRGENYRFCYMVTFSEIATNLEFGSLVRTVSGIDLGGILHRGAGVPPEAKSGDTLEVRLPFCARLLPGAYFFNAGIRGVIDGPMGYLHRIVDAYMFRVEPEQDMTVSGFVDLSSDEHPVVIQGNAATPLSSQ